MDSKSLNLTAEKLAQLRALFPEVFSEDKVDFARLKDILGEHVAFPNEHYELSWAGKAEARREIQKQTTATLVPDKEGSVNFGATENLFIEGENLEVLRILQKSYFGKIKMIYIDPPYNTGNDSFVYPDDYAERLGEYNKRTGTTNEEGYLNKQDLWRKNSRDNGQFHSVWLSMMYPRLYLARNLLREDGVIFVSIGDDEVGNLIALMNEVFGQENQIAIFSWKSRAKPTNAGEAKYRPQKVAEYILAYAKGNADKLKFNILSAKERIYPHQDGKGKFRTTTILTSNRGMFKRETMRFEIGGFKPDDEQRWKAGYHEIKAYYDNGRIGFNNDGIPFLKHYAEDEDEALYPLYTYMDTDITSTAESGKSDLNELIGKNHGLDTVKPVNLLRYLIASSTNTDDIICDFFAGSGTTAQAVLELNEEYNGSNRRFICVQMPEPLKEVSEAYKAGYRTIADICKARISKLVEKLQKARAQELPLETKQALGFQAFILAPSNFKAWRGDVEGEELLKQLDIFRQSEKDGSGAENMLYELLLKSGLPLTAKIEAVKVGEQDIYLVEEGKLFVFFEAYDRVIKETIREKSPQRVVCLDSVFRGKDEDLSNFKLELKEAGIELTII